MGSWDRGVVLAVNILRVCSRQVALKGWRLGGLRLGVDVWRCRLSIDFLSIRHPQNDNWIPHLNLDLCVVLSFCSNSTVPLATFAFAAAGLSWQYLVWYGKRCRAKLLSFLPNTISSKLYSFSIMIECIFIYRYNHFSIKKKQFF